MLIRDTRIIALVLLAFPTIASAQIVNSAMKQPVTPPPSDAGTGPHASQVQVAFTPTATPSNPSEPREHVARLNKFHEDLLYARASGRLTQPQISGFKKRIDDLIGDMKIWLRKHPGKSLAPVNPPVEDPIDVAQRAIDSTLDEYHPAYANANVQGVADRVVSLATTFQQEAADGLYEDFKRRHDAVIGTGTAAFKLGSYFEPGTTYAFTTLTYAGGEKPISEGKREFSYFATASEIEPLNSSGNSPTSRFGLGGVVGNPNNMVTSITMASYLSPFSLDASASVSYRIGGSKLDLGNSETTPKTFDGLEKMEWVDNREPRLLDHIREGDTWLGAEYRYLWDSKVPSNSTPLPDAAAYELLLTYAFREPSFENSPTRNPIPATTFTISETYCAQSAWGLCEVGLELRTPLLVQGFGNHAMYLSLRYGTARDGTISVETAF